MNIEPPVFLGITRLDTRHGVGEYFTSHKKFLELLREQIVLIDPDYIITFGPDGDTHHAEHIVTGAAVTELLLMEGWVEKYPLFYIAWNEGQGKLFNLGHVNEKYFNVRVRYSQEDEDQALEIMPCYKTQFTPEEIIADRENKINDKTNVLHFRRFSIASGMDESFAK
jgi:LmbE family N-acetylglucosaminyl deacetylase